ncbi:MAG: hypothetical protein WCO26_22815, partial [Deltaproteobacteria bacterium]
GAQHGKGLIFRTGAVHFERSLVNNYVPGAAYGAAQTGILSFQDSLGHAEPSQLDTTFFPYALTPVFHRYIASDPARVHGTGSAIFAHHRGYNRGCQTGSECLRRFTVSLVSRPT